MGSKFPTSPAFNTLSFSSWFRKYRFCTQGLQLSSAHYLTPDCYCLVTQPCLTLCNSMDCSTLGFHVLHHLPEFAQTHVHQVSDAIQPSCPLSSPSPPAFSLSQHQGLFQ
ncbi:unnamed protein product [Rangifer tarandus platyrhynchus]|uniref:Uncharacterized protein n=1 Tax=Rangifer tarandus platyrhynchus TaxID=3082113 RepID=A0ABN8Y0L9_RANTA|nr:unnamed protein product [Rangifer tarandus platyrhynchus]